MQSAKRGMRRHNGYNAIRIRFLWCTMPKNTFHSELKFFPQNPRLLDSWLDQWPFHRYITLTLNEQGDGSFASSHAAAQKLTELLKQWDARMNRKLIGRDWLKRQDNRMFYFFTPEKLTSNPHWHGLVRFFGASGDELERQCRIFDEQAPWVWKKLAPAGSSEITPLSPDRAEQKYVVKSTCMEHNWRYSVLPDHFLNR